MAQFNRPSRFPHVLVVTGDDVANAGDSPGYRARLREYLYSDDASSSPVGRGTHDFWVTYHSPTLGGSSNAASGDSNATPRELRTIIYLRDVPAVSGQGVLPDTHPAGDLVNPAFRTHLNTVNHELGHGLGLVPNDITIAGRRVLKSQETTRRLNDGAPFDGPVLIGQGNSHWSAYLQADATIMQAPHWEAVGTDDGFTHWQQTPRETHEISVNGHAPVEGLGSFNDLELYLMGLKRPEECYPDNGNCLSWMEPELTTPMPYVAGLFVAFDEHDYLYFGFRNDHRTLTVHRTGDDPDADSDVTLGRSYRPLAHPSNGLALRVVRWNSGYYCQARTDNPIHGRSLWDEVNDIDAAPTDGRFGRYETVAKVLEGAEPKAVGLINKRTGARGSGFVDAGFWDPELVTNPETSGTPRFDMATRESLLPTNLVPPAVSDGALSDLQRGTFRRHSQRSPNDVRNNQVGNGELFTISDDGAPSLHIRTPYRMYDRDGEVLVGAAQSRKNDYLAHTADVDNAPKVITAAPGENFGFAATARIARSVIVPWAAGATKGKTMTGTLRESPVSSVGVPDRIRNRVQPAPQGGSYRTAFIVVAPTPEDVTTNTLRWVDHVREHADASFRAAQTGVDSSDERGLQTTLSS